MHGGLSAAPSWFGGALLPHEIWGESISILGVHWVALLYKLGKLRYPIASQDTKNTTTHINQHEQVLPNPPAALALSLHGNIRHGPISWRRRLLWS